MKLSYYDLEKKKTVEKVETVRLPISEGRDGLEDASVEKNYTIALLAQAIRDMAGAVELKRYREAGQALNAAVAKTSRAYPNLEDPDIKRTLALAVKYQQVIDEEINSREPERDADRPLSKGPSIIPNGDFSQGNTGFMSGLNYIPPAENGLFAMGYTIAPQWNNPHLHHSFVRDPYPAPKKPNGNEQVFYANAGGTDMLVLWTTVVQCKPNTRYKISFQSISLNGGREWIPSFEIRANGDRSNAQAAGYGAFGEQTMIWQSGNSSTATISIVRMPIPHGGGLIGLSNIEMVPIR